MDLKRINTELWDAALVHWGMPVYHFTPGTASGPIPAAATPVPGLTTQVVAPLVGAFAHAVLTAPPPDSTAP